MRKYLEAIYEKKNLIFSSIFILTLKIGLKFFLTKNNKINNCNRPAKETAYDNVKTSDVFCHWEKNSDAINTIFNTMGAAAAAANLLYELSIAPKKEAKHTKNKKGKVILLKFIARFNFSGSL